MFAKKHSRPSWIWSNILNARHLIKNGLLKW
ncbi:hypothetical protein LINPERHAP2_LOCUS508 [Linum perenne]